MPKSSNYHQEIVPSGSYVISKRKKERLVAHLGSCVGLTICDRKAGIGGLIHLLLPEPTGVDKSWQPLSYATTGLPLFINALQEAGATKKDMEACIAGGALVGQVSQRDLNLDIGGRTAEVMERILSREKIPIRQMETGGLVGCSLILNLTNWKSEINRIGDPFAPSMPNKQKKPTSKEIDKTIQRVRPIPQVALKIVRMIKDRGSSMADVAKELRQDQVISANVLRLCNSSFLAINGKIDSIDRALIVLGEKRLLQLAISASVESFFPEIVQGYSLCKGGHYQHAFGTAVIAEKLADFTGRSASDLAYTGGLLHDIGKVVLDQYITSSYPLFYRGIQEDGLNLIELEAGVLGITHPEAGSRLARHWRLPQNLTDTIYYHHYPEKATSESALVHIIYLADLLMSRFVVEPLSLTAKRRTTQASWRDQNDRNG